MDSQLKPQQIKIRRFYVQKRFWGGLGLALLTLLFLVALSQRPIRVMMQTASNNPIGEAALPALNPKSISEWTESVPVLKQTFQKNIYGTIPLDLQLEEKSRKTLPGLYFDDTAYIDVIMMQISHPETLELREFSVVIARPVNSHKSLPLILSQNFCPNHNVIPAKGIPRPEFTMFDCASNSLASRVFGYIFGRHISTPPLAKIMRRGYAFGAIYPTEFIPDNRDASRAVLNSFFNDTQYPATGPGALAVWAAQFSLVSDYLETDTRYSSSTLYGHSRFGKTALMAAAFNPNIDAVISHQSGTGGASLSRNKPGERISDIMTGYSFWFSDRYKEYSEDQSALKVDQHQLIAMIAPRPILLGNARRDVWSDPNGAFRAAQGANPIYNIYGSNGLTATLLKQFKPADDLSFWIRPGTHGVVKEDWEAFLDFMDAHSAQLLDTR